MREYMRGRDRLTHEQVKETGYLRDMKLYERGIEISCMREGKWKLGTIEM